MVYGERSRFLTQHQKTILGFGVTNSNDMGNVTVQREINPLENGMGDPSPEQAPTSFSKKNAWLAFIRHRHFAPSIYAVLGLLVFLSALVIFNTYVLHLKVETAVISSEIETMVAPMNGYITKLYVKAGEHVKKGAPLLKIDSISLEQALQLAQIQAAESKLDIDYYQHLLSNEQQRLKIYQKIGSNRVISAKTQVNRSLQTVMTSQHNLERFTQLNKKHYVSEASLEAERAKYVSAQETLADAKAQHSTERHALRAISKGMYFTGTKTEGIMQDLDAEIIAAQKKAALNDRRVKVYENLMKKLTLTAPFDGKVTQILKSEGNTADNIKPIILIEKEHSEKQIIAYLTQDEIIHIGVENVKIYFPALGKTYVGNIVEINRTDGFIDEVHAQYRWRDFQIDRSAKVTVAVQQNDRDKFDKIAFSGMPVIVYFPKKHVVF